MDPWKTVYDALGHVGGLILAVMSGAVFLQVVARFAGWSWVEGLDELPRFLFVWLIMIGAASAMQRGEHTVLDYFLNLMSPRWRAATVIATTAASIFLFAYLVKLSFILVPNSQLQTSASLNLPLGYVFVAVPIGAVLIILPMLRLIVRTFRDLWPKRS